MIRKHSGEFWGACAKEREQKNSPLACLAPCTSQFAATLFPYPCKLAKETCQRIVSLMVFQNFFFCPFEIYFCHEAVLFFIYYANVQSYRGWEGGKSEKQRSVIGKRGKEFLSLPLFFLLGYSPPPTPPTKQNGLDSSGETAPLDLNSICPSSISWQVKKISDRMISYIRKPRNLLVSYQCPVPERPITVALIQD